MEYLQNFRKNHQKKSENKRERKNKVIEKIAVISDTHISSIDSKSTTDLLNTLNSVNPDIVIHAGDFTNYSIYSFLTSFYDLKAVYGNCDDAELKKELPEVMKFDIVFDTCSIKFGIKHKPVMPDYSDIYYLARELEVDIMIFGHIHKPIIVSKKPFVFCPGAFKNGQIVLLEKESMEENVEDNYNHKNFKLNFKLSLIEGGNIIDSLHIRV